MASDGLIRKGSERCWGSGSGKRFCTVVNLPINTLYLPLPLPCCIGKGLGTRLFPLHSWVVPSRPLKVIRGSDTAAGDWHGK